MTLYYGLRTKNSDKEFYRPMKGIRHISSPVFLARSLLLTYTLIVFNWDILFSDQLAHIFTVELLFGLNSDA